MTRWLSVTIVLAALSWAGTLYVWSHRALLPEQVPTHWGFAGKPDGFTPRDALLPLLLVFPCLQTGFVLFTLALPWLSPRPFSLDEWRRTYEYVMAIAAMLLCYIHLVILAVWMGLSLDLGRCLVGGLFLFFGLTGNVMGKVRRNLYVGVRTPWTLASTAVWERTHRFAGWLWFGCGFLGAGLVLARVPLWLCFAFFVAAALAPVLYSLVIYKKLQRAGRLETPANS